MPTRRSPEEVQRLLDGYKRTDLTRREYCRQQGISIHMLDYYLRRRTGKSKPRLARVAVAAKPVAVPTSCFTLTLRSGRRIESAWDFSEADLARLIRVAEAL